MQVLQFLLHQGIGKSQKIPLTGRFINEKTKYQQKLKAQTNKEASKQLIVNTISDWEKYYGNELTESNYFNITYCQTDDCNKQLPLSPSQRNAWISNCYFHDISSRSSGGAVATNLNKILIEITTFANCSSTSFGGAINIWKGNCAFNKVCGYECSSSANEAFCNVEGVSNRTVNTVHESSISHCSTTGSYIMIHDYAYIEFKSVNLSHNIAQTCSALSCGPTSKNINGFGTSISYSSFANNNASNDRCIYLGSYASQIKSSNIINNYQNKSGTNGLIRTCHDSKINKCCIVNNNKAPIFHNTPGTLILSECTIGE